MSNDLISRQAALDALEWKWAGKAAIDAIKNLPSAQPEIVRCGECATRDKWGCPWWKDEARPDDWYCADGERREE